MSMKNDIKAMNSRTQRDDFKTQWQRCQQWEEQDAKSVPDDQTFLSWAQKAQQSPAGLEWRPDTIALHHHRRWMPYTVAASIIIAMSLIGLSRHGRTDNPLPTAQEVTVESQTIHFICNNGCSAQDIMLLANKVIK